MSEKPQADVLDGFDHPRLKADIAGHAEAEQTLLEAYRSGRMHHAWILQGSAGIGKATLAYRLAAFMLTNPDAMSRNVQSASDLAVPADVQAARLVRAGSHPDMLTVTRGYDEKRKRLRSVISVDQVRKIPEFFALTAAFGGWRIAIIDTADEMNASAANALLKTLEEPPARSLILLISHAPGRLLATLRSRCRRLALQPLGEEQLLQALRLAGVGDLLDGLKAEERETLLQLSAGSVRMALELLSSGGLELHREIAAILTRWPAIDMRQVHALAAKVARRGGEQEFDFTFAAIRGWLERRLDEDGARGLAPMAEVWEKLGRLKADSDIFNFDRKQVILKAFRSVAALANEP